MARKDSTKEMEPVPRSMDRRARRRTRTRMKTRRRPFFFVTALRWTVRLSDLFIKIEYGNEKEKANKISDIVRLL